MVELAPSNVDSPRHLVDADADIKEGGEYEAEQLDKSYVTTFSNDFNVICPNYFNQLRSEGDGPVRINTSISLREDVYATAFASMLRYQYVEASEK